MKIMTTHYFWILLSCKLLFLNYDFGLFTIRFFFSWKTKCWTRITTVNHFNPKCCSHFSIFKVFPNKTKIYNYIIIFGYLYFGHFEKKSCIDTLYVLLLYVTIHLCLPIMWTMYTSGDICVLSRLKDALFLRDIFLRPNIKYSSCSVKHSRDIKTSSLVQWLCNHSHKFHLALLWKFGQCRSLELSRY